MSKFAFLRQGNEDSQEQNPEKLRTQNAENTNVRQSENVDNQNSSSSDTQIPNRPGRPKGKRSNPDYEQVTAYIRKGTYKATKRALLDDASERQFSELVQELLEQWLQQDQNS
jgi:hypothetical protein